MIDTIGQIRKFGVIGVQMRSVISENVAPYISYTFTQTGRGHLTRFCRFDVNSMAHVYVMHVCNLYMACASCLLAGKSQSVVIIMYNDLRVDL
jgi:hypothetical protein